MFQFSCLTENIPASDPIIEISESRLRNILSYLISEIDIQVDEVWYRRNYSDVDQAIKAGVFESGCQHYRKAGYFENRLPRPVEVDEIWYLNEYSDVAAAVSNGVFKSGAEHFFNAGFKEGRQPRRGWSLFNSSPPRRLGKR